MNRNMSTVRVNILTVPEYTPYCGEPKCRHGMPRTYFNGNQFQCDCGWQSGFDTEFINQYTQKWELK